MNKLHYIDFRAYPILVGITDCPKIFQKELRRLNIKDDCDFVASGCAGMTHFFSSDVQEVAIICIDRKKLKSKDAVIPIIVHECVHVWQQCKLVMGETNPGKEVEAYAIQWLFQSCLKAIFKK